MNEHRIIIQEKQELEKALKKEKELVEALSKVNEIETDFTQYSFWINYSSWCTLAMEDIIPKVVKHYRNNV